MDKQFLKNFPNFYLQTFDDKEDRKEKALTTCGVPKVYQSRKLTELNEKGAGIFFTPNQFTTRRLAKECKGVNAWIVEMDGISKQDQWKKINNAPLLPSIVVDSKSSLHCYWLAEEGTIENYKRVVSGLIKYFDGDPACKDISRVLRIPGFYHNKQEPYLVKVVYYDYAHKNHEEDMLEAFPFEEKVEHLPPINKPIVEGLDFWEAVSRLDNKQVLMRISDTHVGNFESISFRPRSGGGEFIDVNGKPADCWLDERGLIGSGKNAGPTFVQWLGYYGWSKGDIAKWIKSTLSDMLPQSALINKPVSKLKENKENDLGEDIDACDIDIRELIKEPSNFTWGVDIIDEKASSIEKGKYIMLVGETGAGKTAFALNMAIKNAEKGNRVLYLSLEMSNDGLLLRYAVNRAKISKKDFKDRNFDPDNVQAYVNSIPKELKMKKLWGNLDLEVVKKIMDEDYDMVFIDNFGFIDTGGQDENEKTKIISRELVNLKKRTNSVIVALHHYRKGAKMSSKRVIEDIMGSAKLGQDVEFAIKFQRDMDLDEDAFEKDKAACAIKFLKDRDFGDLIYQTIYYVDGEFLSYYPI